MNTLEILPVKTNNTKQKSDIPDPIPQHPFTMCLIAPTASGKTVTLVNLIYRFYKHNFDEIIYISPTVLIDETLENNVSKDDDITKIHEEEDLKNIDTMLDEIVKEQKESPKKDRKKLLIVLDDMIGHFKRHSTLDNLPALSRHYDISFIICCQSFNPLPTRLRKNASHYLIYRLYNKADLDCINKEVGCNYENFEQHYKNCIDEKYSFMFLDNKKMKIYKKFTNLLWQK